MSDYSPFTGRHREPPMPVLISECWRMIGPSNVPLVCGLYRHIAGIEVRCFYTDSPDNLVQSELAPDMDIAKDIAEAWRMATLATGGFTELKGH